jgi:TPR repeat protein
MREFQTGLLCLAMLGGVAAGAALGQDNGVCSGTIPIGQLEAAPTNGAGLAAPPEETSPIAGSVEIPTVGLANATTARRQTLAPSAGTVSCLHPDNAAHADANADYERGLALSQGLDRPADPEAAVRAYLQAARAGHTGAQFELGWAFETGLGVAQSDSRARFWYGRAVDGGDARAMNNLGWLLAHGRGGARDETRASELYRAAADAGEASGMANLGWLMENGIGMAQDLYSAAALYARAAEAGETQSMLNLGNLYLVGDGVPRNTTQALVWFARARSAGRAEALSYIGEVYENSPELRDVERAATFYVRALEAGDTWPAARALASWDGETAKALQRILAERGLYTGLIDGQIGPASRSAMRKLLTGAETR